LRFARPPRNADFLRRLKDGGLHRRILWNRLLLRPPKTARTGYWLAICCR